MKKLTIVKVGGAVLEDEEKRKDFLSAFSKLKGHKILVHGGGRLADHYLNKLDIELKKIDGRRITDQETLDVVTMVYAGLVNKKVVAELQSNNQNALGLTGADLGLIRSLKRSNVPVDYGFVGDVESVDNYKIAQLLEQETIPVFAPLTFSKEGQLLNTNADTIASELAKSFINSFEVQLIFCFELSGVLDEHEQLISEITLSQFSDLKRKEIVKGGMIPKLDNAFSVIQKGVKEVRICNYSSLAEKSGTKLSL
ncbi:MAG: acetylglutamate kinase [Bacteroidota bacterium]